MSPEQSFCYRQMGQDAAKDRIESQCFRYGNAKWGLNLKMEALDAAKKDKLHIASLSMLLFATVVQVVAIGVDLWKGIEGWEMAATAGVQIGFMLLTSGSFVYLMTTHRMRVELLQYEVSRLRGSVSLLKDDIEWTLMEYPELKPMRERLMNENSAYQSLYDVLHHEEGRKGCDGE